MSDFITIKPSILEGEVNISGAKNSVLKLLAATLLTDEPVTISNFPSTLSDALIHLEMLKKLGKKCVKSECGKVVTITQDFDPPNDLSWSDRSIRNTLLILGCLFGKNGKMKVPIPGGCKLGDRKHDIHTMVIESFGGIVEEGDDYLMAYRKGSTKGCDIHLPIRSTGATENAILIAVLAEGVTNIWNPHIRPEVIDLIDMLTEMGAKISVKGQERIVIEGVNRLGGVNYEVIPDNMEALTWVIAATITSGSIDIKNFPFEHLEVPLIFLRESGVKIYRCGNDAIVRPGYCYPIEISTGPYPGINSDMQPIMAAFSACSNGKSKIVDLRFSGRYAYAEQFKKMGIKTNIENTNLIIYGKGREGILPAEVKATDLRAGISLALLGMANLEGETKISEYWQIERGYCDFRNKVLQLGGKIE